MFYSRNGGFTIVELMVAVGLFVVVVGIASATFVQALRTQRQVVGLMAANDNASLTLEQMAREIRTGTQFALPGASGNEGIELKFQNADDVTVHYRLNNSVIEREADGRTFPITGNNVQVSTLAFHLVHNEIDWPPRITITLSVAPVASTLQAIVTNLQTTASGRNF